MTQPLRSRTVTQHCLAIRLLNQSSFKLILGGNGWRAG